MSVMCGVAGIPAMVLAFNETYINETACAVCLCKRHIKV